MFDPIIHCFYRALTRSVLLPLRNRAFISTRKAKISETEKEALASGSVGFEGEILRGRPDWRKLLDLPTPHLSPEEQAFLDGPVEDLCRLLDDWKIRTELHDLPREIWDFMKEHRFFGMIIPKEYDGLGFSALAHAQVVQKLASRSTTACVTTMVPNSLGPAELLIRYGTEEQKSQYLPRLAVGEEIPCFALTEPEAGSDASGMTSRGVVCERDGKLGILLNWDKRYITLSPVATLLGLAFKLYDPDRLLNGISKGNKEEIGITLALIPVNTPGVTIGKRHNPLGIPFQNGPTSGKDVWVPLESIIGGREFAGQGWRMLMECLSVGRSVSLPALSAGSAKYVCLISGAYSRIRKQFKIPISQFEGVEELLARMAGTTYLMEAARIATLQMLDRGEHPTILSAVLKYHMTEGGRRIVNDGMDILGGKAICEGPGNPISALYHGIPIGITVEGANILTRNMIIFGQASVRSHPFVLKEMEAARLADIGEAKRQFTDLMARHVRNSAENTFLSFFYGVTNGLFSKTPNSARSERIYYRHINRLCAAYATLADFILMMLGDAVKRKERLSALLGDAMSYLYFASCTLRHFAVQGRPAEDAPLMHWACHQMLYQAEESLDRLLLNFPAPPGLGVLQLMLRLVVFPTGRKLHPPSHKLERQVAKILLQPGAARNRLTQGIYIPPTLGVAEALLNEPVALLEQCFEDTVVSEPVESRIRKAKKDGDLQADTPAKLLQEALTKNIITAEEAERLRRAEVNRRKIIQVDEFDADFGSHEIRLAVTDDAALRRSYPIGTRWNLEIPHIDLVSLMETAVTRFGNGPCIDFLGKKYTYQEVGTLITKAAAGLQAIGVTPGTKIGLYMANTPYYPILFFAALKVGAVVVNFCPLHTVAELREQVLDSDVRIMATLDLREMYDKAEQLRQEGTIDRIFLCRMEDALPFFKAQAYRMMKSAQIAKPPEADDSEVTRLPSKNATLIWFKALISATTPYTPVPLSPDDTAVLQYTGGTTGTPKGAMLTHYNLVANIYQIEEFFRASNDKPESASLLKTGKERLLACIPYFHVFGMTVAMLSGLKMGGELLILPNPRNIKETLKTIREKRPTLFPAVPRLVQAICESPKAAMYDISSMGAVITGGAALPPNLKQTFETLCQKNGLIKQGYGLTECAPVATSNPPYGTNKSDSVGLPVPQTRVKITDPDDPGRTLKIGEIGEICIAGPQVMKGYYRRDAETAEVFHEGWLRTGDLGYLDEECYLHLVDRKKRLILVNGHSIYPTQIEQAITKHPNVLECIVVSIPDERSGEAAKAFIRLKPGVEISQKEMLEFLSDHISRIELPKVIEFVDRELPKTAVGKPDWKSLQTQERLRYEEYAQEDSYQGQSG